MDDSQLLRYSRHILLPEVGIEGQMRLLASRVLILGAGGLGSPVAMFLASSGIGTITLCDDDRVDLTNLQRQIAHQTHSIGRSKVDSAKTTLTAINPGITIIALPERADEQRMAQLVSEVDLVLDCSDNFPTRYALNRVCSKLNKPLVSGAATRFDGQVSVFDFRHHDSPCYHCLFPEQMESEETRCSVLGIFAPLVGIIGCLQAAEAIKLLSGIETTLCGRLLTVNALTMEIRTMKLVQDPTCAVCQSRAA